MTQADTAEQDRRTSADPMRVLMIAARCAPFVGGIETHINEVAPRLAAKGHAVTTLSTDASWKLPEAEQRAGVNHIRVRAWPRNRDFHWAPGILSQVARGEWDVIHVQGYHTFSAPLGMYAAIANKIPFVITYHSGGHSSPLRNSIRRLQHGLLRPFIARAAKNIGVSEYESEFFAERLKLPTTSFVVAPNGAKVGEIDPAAPPRDAQSVNILSVGRLEKYKGHHRVLRAFAEYVKLVPHARLRILGEGPYKEALIQLRARLGLQDQVEIGGVPAADRKAMTHLLTNAALVVLMSDYEAHPVAVMEALSLNVRVLTSDTSGFRELARDGLVRAVPLDVSPHDLAAAMAEEVIAGPPAKRVQLPDWDDCADRLESIYRDVVANRRRERAVFRGDPRRSSAPLENVS